MVTATATAVVTATRAPRLLASSRGGLANLKLTRRLGGGWNPQSVSVEGARNDGGEPHHERPATAETSDGSDLHVSTITAGHSDDDDGETSVVTTNPETDEGK